MDDAGDGLLVVLRGMVDRMGEAGIDDTCMVLHRSK